MIDLLILYRLFLAVGWATKGTTTPEILNNFNIGFIHSTFVFSAWDGERLVGCVRVLSDLKFRSVIYDLAVLPDYQRMGIGTNLGKNAGRPVRIPAGSCRRRQPKNFIKRLDFPYMTKKPFLL